MGSLGEEAAEDVAGVAGVGGAGVVAGDVALGERGNVGVGH